MDAFVISSLPSRLRRRYKQKGPFAPRTLLRFLDHTDPSATLSPSIDFPVEPVIRSTLLRRFLTGTRRASPVARHVLAAVLSLPPRQGEGAVPVSLRRPMLPSPLRLQARPLVPLNFEATFAFTVVTARRLVISPRKTLSIGFRVLVTRHPAIQTTGLPTFTPAGLSPAEHASLRWTHNRAGGFPKPLT